MVVCGRAGAVGWVRCGFGGWLHGLFLVRAKWGRGRLARMAETSISFHFDERK